MIELNESNISVKEYKFYRDLFRSTSEVVELPVKSFINYCAIFGSLPGKNVAAKSELAVEFHQLMVNGSLNIR